MNYRQRFVVCPTMLSNPPHPHNRDRKFDNTVLLAAGYNANWLTTLTIMASRFGQTLAFVPLTKELPADDRFSEHSPFSDNRGECILSDILETVTPKLLIIPAGDRCIEQLFVDPRVHQFIMQTAAAHGKIALAAGAQLACAHLLPKFRLAPTQLFLQQNLRPIEFAKQLFDC